jgi:hypothetical protein
MANGKAKGGSFERDIARCLTKWFSGQDKELYFWRSQSSGGLATIANQAHIGGDIVAIKEEGYKLTNKYSIEIKTGYENTCMFQHLKNIKNFNIEVFWKQCILDANKADKLPMLIYRKKGIVPVIGFTTNDALRFSNKDIQSVSLVFSCDKNIPDITFFNFEEFLEKVSKEELLK